MEHQFRSGLSKRLVDRSVRVHQQLRYFRPKLLTVKTIIALFRRHSVLMI